MRIPQQQEAIDGVDDMLAMIEQLTSERDYLDDKCAEFEKLAREFVNYEIDNLIARAHFEALLNDEKEG